MWYVNQIIVLIILLYTHIHDDSVCLPSNQAKQPQFIVKRIPPSTNTLSILAYAAADFVFLLLLGAADSF